MSETAFLDTLLKALIGLNSTIIAVHIYDYFKFRIAAKAFLTWEKWKELCDQNRKECSDCILGKISEINNSLTDGSGEFKHIGEKLVKILTTLEYDARELLQARLLNEKVIGFERDLTHYKASRTEKWAEVDRKMEKLTSDIEKSRNDGQRMDQVMRNLKDNFDKHQQNDKQR